MNQPTDKVSGLTDPLGEIERVRQACYDAGISCDAVLRLAQHALAAPASADSPIKAVTVTAPDGSPVAAPCAISGCQYTAASSERARVDAALRACDGLSTLDLAGNKRGWLAELCYDAHKLDEPYKAGAQKCLEIVKEMRAAIVHEDSVDYGILSRIEYRLQKVVDKPVAPATSATSAKLPQEDWRLVLIREAVRQYIANESTADAAVWRVAACAYPDGKVTEADMQWAKEQLARSEGGGA